MNKVMLVLAVLFTVAGCATPDMGAQTHNIPMDNPYAKPLQTPIP